MCAYIYVVIYTNIGLHVHLFTSACVGMSLYLNVAQTTNNITCRYLALVAALACEADFVFVPEYPHKEGWEEKLCKKLQSVCL